MKIKLNIFIILIMTISIISSISAQKISFSPWDTKLVKVEQKKQAETTKMPSTTSWFLNRFVRAFQLYISPQDGPNCRYSPTCAKYGEICINQYGPFLGTIMAVDRFMRCNPFGAWGKDLPEDNYFGNKKDKKK